MSLIKFKAASTQCPTQALNMWIFPPQGNLLSQPVPAQPMLLAHQGVPIGPAEVVLHSSVTEADPLVDLCVAWKIWRGREK